MERGSLEPVLYKRNVLESAWTQVLIEEDEEVFFPTCRFGNSNRDEVEFVL